MLNICEKWKGEVVMSRNQVNNPDDLRKKVKKEKIKEKKLTKKL